MHGVSNIGAYFQLDIVEELCSCFPDNEKNIRDRLGAYWQRVKHLSQTGKWINEKRVVQYVKEHPQEGVSGFFDGKSVQRKIVRAELGLYSRVPTPSIWTFFKSFLRNGAEVGAAFPCSRYVSKEIVRMIAKDTLAKPRLIIEGGAGEGALTEEILKRMNSGDKLVLLELLPELRAKLREKFGHCTQVEIPEEGDILQYTSAEKADVVIGAIPMNSMSKEVAPQLLEKYEDLTKPGGYFSNVHYRFLPEINRVLLRMKRYVPLLGKLATNHANADDFNQIVYAKDDFFKLHGIAKRTIWRNFPPAAVWHHRFKQKAE